VEGYRTGITDLFALPLFSLIILVAFIVRIGSGKSASAYLKTLDAPVARFFSLQITLGMILICNVLVVALLMLGPVYIFSAARYAAVAKYCLARRQGVSLPVGPAERAAPQFAHKKWM
jgi:hypothetical protein